MDLKLSQVKLIFNSYKTSNKLAFTFDQIQINRVTCKLNSTDATNNYLLRYTALIKTLRPAKPHSSLSSDEISSSYSAK